MVKKYLSTILWFISAYSIAYLTIRIILEDRLAVAILVSAIATGITAKNVEKVVRNKIQ